jgi:glycerophosphoryl diester phosphodiesterase
VRKLDIQGHRGARGLRPESTLPSFETALDLGVTTLEMDVHLSANGVPVVWHDPYVSRKKCRLEPGTTGPDPDKLPANDPQLLLANLTLRQLNNYLCDRNPDPGRFPEQTTTPTAMAGTNYRMATLGDVLDLTQHYGRDASKTQAQRAAAQRVRFNVETKRVPDHPEYIGDGFDGTTAGKLEVEVLRVLRKYAVLERTTIQSFDHRSLRAVHALDPEVAVVPLTVGLPPLEAYLIWKGAGAVAWSPNYKVLTPEHIEAAHAAGLQVIPWTVNDPDDIKTVLALGVDGIISDRPDLLVSGPR